MTRDMDLHEAWGSDPADAREYDALDEELGLARALTEAPLEAGLSRDDLAARLGSRERVIARIESGAASASTRTLMRIARATGTRLRIGFEPAPTRGAATGAVADPS